MKVRTLILILPALALGCGPAAGAAGAGPFAATLDRLAVSEPEFLLHLDLEGDFAALGSLLNNAWLGYLSGGPGVPPVPVDFQRLFGRLGLTDLVALTAVSAARPGGGFVNQALFRFAGPPRGPLFTLAGETNLPFRVPRQAPADADLAVEFTLNGEALLRLVHELAGDWLGPLGQGAVDMQLDQPLFDAGMSARELVARLTTRVRLFLQPALAGVPGQPVLEALLTGRGILVLEGAANLLQDCAPLLRQAGFVETGQPPRSEWRWTAAGGPIPFGIALQVLPGSDDLAASLAGDSLPWLLGPGPRLADAAAFTALAAGLPDSGVSFWYTTGRLDRLQIDNLDAQLPLAPAAVPAVAALKAFLQRHSGPGAGAAVLEADALRVISHERASTKTRIALSAAAIPFGVAATAGPLIRQRLQPPAPAPEAAPPAAGDRPQP